MDGLHSKKAGTSQRRIFTAAALFMVLSSTGNLYCAASCEVGADPVTPVADCPMHSGQPANDPHNDRGDHSHSYAGCSDSKVAPEKASQIQPTEVALPFYEASLPLIKEPAATVIFLHSLDPTTSPPLRLFLRLKFLRL